jgi:hypothetical protein
VCQYITLIVRGETTHVASALWRHGRRATGINNPSVRRVLGDQEEQFLTTAGHCDCGTVLASAPAHSADYEIEAERLREKGWPEAKIERRLRDRDGADERPEGEPTDSFRYWAGVLHDVIAAKGVTAAGLIVHRYLGSVADESFSLSRREIPLGGSLESELGRLCEDELLLVRRRSGRLPRAAC